MSLDTACFSMYSLMSIRTMASSVLKRKVASVLASSVLPTPVGPRNMKDAMGRLGSDRPARERWIASVTACTAVSWPTTRLCSSAGRLRSFSRSPSWSLETGMPVHLEMISAMSASVTSSRSKSPPCAAAASIAASASRSSRCRFIRLPYLSSAALLRS